jgi:two-component system, OmpR family, response regulator
VNLLLVEDDARIATFLRKGLRSAGYSVEWVTTGSEALTRARIPTAARPDVMVLDLGLPDLDGLDVLAALRDCGCRTRVVIATARETASDRARAAALGVQAYLTKPFSVAELVDSLTSWNGISD